MGRNAMDTHTLIPRRPFMRSLAGVPSSSGESGMVGRILKEMSSLSSITFRALEDQ